jgi:hypothetical protein
MSDSKKCRIQGTVAPGFESIRQLYEHNMNTMAEENTQLCAYYQGKQVVDLWASTTNDSSGHLLPFSLDSALSLL